MAQLAQKQPFIPSGEFVVRRAFLFDAVQYASGDDFPHEEIGVEPRKLRNLFEAGFLQNKPAEVKKSEKKKTITKDEGDEEDTKPVVKQPKKKVITNVKKKQVITKISQAEWDERERKAAARKARREARKARKGD